MNNSEPEIFVLYNGQQTNKDFLPVSVQFHIFYYINLTEQSGLIVKKVIPDGTGTNPITQVYYDLYVVAKDGTVGPKQMVRKGLWVFSNEEQRRQFNYHPGSNTDFLPIIDTCPPPPPLISIIEKRQGRASKRKAHRGRSSFSFGHWPPLPSGPPPALPPLPPGIVPVVHIE